MTFNEKTAGEDRYVSNGTSEISVYDKQTQNKYVINLSNGSITTVDRGGNACVQDCASVSQAKRQFGQIIHEIGQKTGEMPLIVEGGLGALVGQLSDADMVLGALKAGGAKVGKFFGSLSKVLGPLGVANATAEIIHLENKAEMAIEMGLLSADAMLAYDGILAAHVAQATADPTLVGGEIVVQGLFDEWARQYDVPRYLQGNLRPDSLLGKIFARTDAPPGYRGEEKDPYDNHAIIDSSRLPAHVALTQDFNIHAQFIPELQVTGPQLQRMLQSLSECDVSEYGPEMQTLWQFRECSDSFMEEFENFRNDGNSVSHINGDLFALENRYQDLQAQAPSRPLATAENRNQTVNLDTYKM